VNQGNGSYIDTEEMKMEENRKELQPEELKQAAGGEWDGHHTCGICGSEMKFLRKQEGAFPAVYECPRCKNVDVFPY
jgi:hypothetical protein